MSRLGKWLIAAAATLVAFVLCLWAGWEAGIMLWPHALESAPDRWVVAAAFATVMAGAVLACFGWWAGLEKKLKTKSIEGPITIQELDVREGSTAYSVQHGNQHFYNYQVPDMGPKSSAMRQDNQDGHG